MGSWLERILAVACPNGCTKAGAYCGAHGKGGLVCSSRIQAAEDAEDAWHYLGSGGAPISACGVPFPDGAPRWTAVPADVTCPTCQCDYYDLRARLATLTAERDNLAHMESSLRGDLERVTRERAQAEAAATAETKLRVDVVDANEKLSADLSEAERLLDLYVAWRTAGSAQGIMDRMLELDDAVKAWLSRRKAGTT